MRVHLLDIERQVETLVLMRQKQGADVLPVKDAVNHLDVFAVSDDHVNACAARDLCGLQLGGHAAGADAAPRGRLAHIHQLVR